MANRHSASYDANETADLRPIRDLELYVSNISNYTTNNIRYGKKITPSAIYTPLYTYGETPTKQIKNDTRTQYYEKLVKGIHAISCNSLG